MSVVPRTSQVSDLLDLLHGGDQAARARLLDYAANRLKKMAHAMLHTNRVKRWEQSDDLLQQTLVRLNRSLDNREIDNVASFFRLAALEMRHALVDLCRRYFGPEGMGTHHDTVGDEPSGQPLQVFVSANAMRVARTDQFRQLYEAVDSLPEEERVVVDLLWIHELSQIEAAAILGVTTKTIARRWARARLLLHQDLTDNAANEST